MSVPKRVLAVELSARIAEEMATPLGHLVGYEIRGEKRSSKETRILFMTEGMLRAKIRSNPTLEGVSVVLFDEFHERSLMSDFNVALVERAQNEGSKVAFLLMSATADAGQLASHFDCGMIDGSDLTTMYPITERYAEANNGSFFAHTADVVADLVVGSGRKMNGLVFMPGKAEIAETVSAIEKLGLHGVTVLPLHGDLDRDDRHAPFAERTGVTITVATDIVETGATLPNVGWVVDSGIAREVSYNPVSDTSGLSVVEVAQDRLTQRRGRCGRVRAGEYVGLFSEKSKAQRPAKTQPEIFRKPLREVVHTIKSLGLSRIGNPLRLIDNPPKANWQEAKRQLQLLKLVDETPEANITPLGRKAVELGCDPRDAAMLLAAVDLGCVREVAIAIAARESKPLLIRPKNREEYALAERAHYRFRQSRIMDAWTSISVIRAAEARGEQSLGAWVRENYISYRAVQDVWTAERQLVASIRQLGLPVSEGGTEEQVRQAICIGLPDKIFSGGYRGRYTDQQGRGALLGRESTATAGKDGKIAAWHMIVIPGPGRIITNAVQVK